jgi:hypothetical protein
MTNAKQLVELKKRGCSTTIETLTPQILAAKFAELLHEQLGRGEMAKVIARNRREPSESVCHSHDFLDANMVMDDAFLQILGYSACDTGGEGIGCMSDKCMELWNAAWTIAKNSEFNKEKIFA